MSTNGILQQFHAEQRTAYIWMTCALALFSVFVLFNQETWASLYMFAIVTAFIWAYHWNNGRRIRNGTFAANLSNWSRIEQADLKRWAEHRGATSLTD
jgi:hypothetical protein